MGSRKHNTAQEIKEAKKTTYFAKLNNCPTSPRKMRLVADMIRGMEVAKASAILQFTKKESSIRMEKLLRSAIANYEQKTGDSWENANLYVKEVYVDSARMLKRIQPAPQGRAHRIRKRSNHVTIVLDNANQEVND
ncbi:MAG: 50S ribosomal protein L22 [Crocinitomicaceae bacterium]|nr:50S ribosomal protein L22 [Crocinitomicaceae bacterium]|tara:strand:- start:518 stop:925 length:408 start_codon:yes stop_codon:yes gene_type:complete